MSTEERLECMSNDLEKGETLPKNVDPVLLLQAEKVPYYIPLCVIWKR